ncbi:MAG: hypothetical protein JWN27_963 [Candidatus Eremiobacteraeota bacterium]|nr:hypothetical protein [Candidatus Eremiobacteraeota bacterium]
MAPASTTAQESAAIRSFIHVAMHDLKIPGASIDVVQNDAIVFAEGFGVTSLDDVRPVTAETRANPLGLHPRAHFPIEYPRCALPAAAASPSEEVAAAQILWFEDPSAHRNKPLACRFGAVDGYIVRQGFLGLPPRGAAHL